MKSIRYTAAVCAALSFTLPAAAQVTVSDPWIRGTVPQQMATGAFMQLRSAKDAKLIEARSPAAGVVEIHEMTMENNVMRMRAMQALVLPAGSTVELKPGGYHMMLMDLKQQLKIGEVVPMTLVVETAGKREVIEVKATVRGVSKSGDTMKQQGK
ncbi:MAG: copper chaperone PCu(A)C [Burkholderiaceae bacterium]|jgi:copper(I)-binding protein|nr:copper chaperone PCu(A)C [Burkholderiaceae bacterium]